MNEVNKARAELLRAKAAKLEADALQHDADAQAMVRTTERTNGRFGHINNPYKYAYCLGRAAQKRLQAAELRLQAAELEAQV